MPITQALAALPEAPLAGLVVCGDVESGFAPRVFECDIDHTTHPATHLAARGNDADLGELAQERVADVKWFGVAVALEVLLLPELLARLAQGAVHHEVERACIRAAGNDLALVHGLGSEKGVEVVE